MLTLTKILILTIVQGMAELLPISSSAHVIVAARLMDIHDTSTPQFTLMLVMLHTGTMFAVIAYFWNAWKRVFFSSKDAFLRFATKIIIATIVTGIIGGGLVLGIEKYMDPGYTVLASQLVTQIGTKTALPGKASPLVRLAAADAPQTPLFKAGDLLMLSGIRGGEDLRERTMKITAATTLKDLMKFYQDGLEIKPASAAQPGALAAGVSLQTSREIPNAVQVMIVGNEGHENKLKLPEKGFINQRSESPLSFDDVGKAEIEQLFTHLDLLAAAMLAGGLLILYSGIRLRWQRYPRKGITTADSVAIGAIQGLCLPFRGFSRSGATISVGLLRGVARNRLEEFSFALAVVLTPAVIGREALRLITHHRAAARGAVNIHDFAPSLLGMLFSFVAGIVALWLLSKLLEKGQWWLFGVYCLFAAGGIYWMHLMKF